MMAQEREAAHAAQLAAEERKASQVRYGHGEGCGVRVRC